MSVLNQHPIFNLFLNSKIKLNVYIKQKQITHIMQHQPTNYISACTCQTESYQKQIAANQSDIVLNNKIPHMHIYHQTHN